MRDAQQRPLRLAAAPPFAEFPASDAVLTTCFTLSARDGLTRSPSTGEFSGLPRHQRGKEIVALEERIRSLNQEAFARYWALASERAARNVQKRRTMTPRQRLAIPPWETED